MNRAICEREDQTSAAIRSGAIGQETAAHARQCPVCSEILLVSEFLQEGMALADHERTTLPRATGIWQKARLRANDEAVRLALRPIRLMKVVAVIAFALSPWLRLLPITRALATSWSKAFDLNFAFFPKIWSVTANQAVILLGCSGTILLLGLSSWYMLREE